MTKDLEQEARISLLHYYSSKCTAHGTNILAIAVGFFAYVESISFVPSFLTLIVNSVFLPAFIVLFSHQIVRLLVWGHYTQTVLDVDPEKVEKDWGEKMPSKKNMLHRLVYSCWIDFKNNPKRKQLWSMNSNMTNMRILLVFWIILCFVTFVIQTFIIG